MNIKKIQSIIKKARKIFKHTDYSELVTRTADISMRELDDGNIDLEEITFCCSDGTLHIYENFVLFLSVYNNQKKIFEYDGWEGFLNI